LSANTKTLTLVAPPTEPACPAFCLRHDPLAGDLCIGPVIELDFGPADPDDPQRVHFVRILTTSEPGAGATLSLVVNRSGSSDLTPAQARQIAAALIQAADATEAGVR
jgi:hypothetical protein